MTETSNKQRLTFNPIHLILPTSSLVKGLNNLPIVSFFPVASPGLKTDLPLYTLTSTSLPSLVATPTSTSESTGSPRRMVVEEDFGLKRTRPRQNQYKAVVMVEGGEGGRSEGKDTYDPRWQTL